MESYTTISVRPQLKKKIKKLKEDETYNEYLEKTVNEEWDESDYDEDDLEE